MLSSVISFGLANFVCGSYSTSNKLWCWLIIHTRVTIQLVKRLLEVEILMMIYRFLFRILYFQYTCTLLVGEHLQTCRCVQNMILSSKITETHLDEFLLQWSSAQMHNSTGRHCFFNSIGQRFCSGSITRRWVPQVGVPAVKVSLFSSACWRSCSGGARTTRCVENVATTVRSLLCWNQTTWATMEPGMRVLLLLKHLSFRFLLVTKH